MTPRQRTRSTFITKPDLVSTTLIYPMTMTTGSGNLDGFLMTTAVDAPLAQPTFQVKDSGGTARVVSTCVGGAYSLARDVRAYNSAGTAYVALSGRNSPACVEFPDGSSAQGAKMWGGKAAPSSTTVGTAAVGDFYMRRAEAAAVTCVAASTTTATTQTTLAVGYSATSLDTSNTSNLKNGVPAAGDLLIAIVQNTEASATLSIVTPSGSGMDTAITATGTDGGYTATDSTRYIRMFSHVIQAGDIVNSQIHVGPSAHSVGSGRRITAYVFRHPGGFSTTGSKHGCPLVASASDTAGGTGFTMTASAASSRAPIEIAANYASGSNTTTYRFDGGDATTLSNDWPGGTSNNATGAARPGNGLNSSGATGSTAALTPSVVLASAGATHIAALGVWQPTAAGAEATDPFLYVCTEAGSPGTWKQII